MASTHSPSALPPMSPITSTAGLTRRARLRRRPGASPAQPSRLAHGEPPSADPLDHIGLDDDRRAELAALGDAELQPARVARVDRGLIHVSFERSGARRLPWPPAPVAVGDWVAVAPDDRVTPLERRSALVRRDGDATRASTAHGQVLAANVDVVAALRALDSGISLSRVQALRRRPGQRRGAARRPLEVRPRPTRRRRRRRRARGRRRARAGGQRRHRRGPRRSPARPSSGRSGVFLGESGWGN